MLYHETNRPRAAQRWKTMAHTPPSDILIVDDEPAIATLIAEIVQDLGYKARTTHDGASALLEIVAQRPGMVLLDVAMPVMLGDSLLHYLRSHGYHDLPVVMMTANPHSEVYLTQGATAVLSKPFELDRLVELIETYGPPHAQRQQNA